MRSLADFSGQWVVIDSDHNVVASGDTPHEARQSAAETQQELGLSLGWVAPYSPQVVLPYWPLQPVIELASTGIWLAGGAVRDLLMGRSPRDWDFVVPRQGIVLARAVANAMDGAFYVLDAERGIGRALVREPSTGEPTFLDFAEMRGPTLEDDLQLRDFTVNAMSLTMDGRLNDPTGGQEDLAERRIRLTHCGSLLQDPVRLVRAVRIAVELDFEIAPETAKQIQIDAPAVVGVAAERLRDELVKLFALAHADRGLQLLSDLGLLARILPEAIPDAAVRRDVADRTAPPGARRGQLLQTSKVLIRAASTDAEAQDSIPNLAAELADLTAMTRDFRQDLAAYLSGHLGAGLTRGDLAPWCALFLAHHRGVEASRLNAANAEARLAKLRFPARACAFVTATVRDVWRFPALPDRPSLDDADSRRALYRYFQVTADAGVMTALLSLAKTLVNTAEPLSMEAWHAHLLRLRAVLIAYFRRRDEIVDPAPLLTGTDLLQIGFPQGPELGEALASLREAQAAGEVQTEAEARAWISFTSPRR